MIHFLLFESYKESLHEGPHGDLEFLAFDVMELGNDGLVVIHFGLHLRHH